MIDAQKAYELATQEPGFPLAPVAYDYGDKWVFDYGGTKEIIGFWPVTINKKDGRLDFLEFTDCFEFLDKKESLPSINVSE